LFPKTQVLLFFQFLIN